MFDITSSKLLLLGIVALLVIGPKDFPALMRTIGKYMGIVRGHAREFRAQFDEAMRESELEQLKKQVETVAQETEASFQASTREVEQTLDEARRDLDRPVETGNKPAPDPLVHDADGLPVVPPLPAPATETAEAALNGASHPPEPQPQAQETPQHVTGENRPTEKSGA
jgi:sec-independent protein translocase protein TatB